MCRKPVKAGVTTGLSRRWRPAHQLAVGDLARFAVVNSVAVAHVQSVGRAKPPDSVLNKTREFFGKPRIKRADINAVCDHSDDLGTATSGVAGSPIDVGRAATFQNAGAVQKIMHEGVDGHHGLAGLEPDGPLATRPYQQAG